MSLSIDFNGDTGEAFYAFLFNASDKTQAFNPTTGNFETFTLTSQQDFVILLTEDSERLGYFNATITDTTNISATTTDQFYLVEIFQALGLGSNGSNSPLTYDRSTDSLLGSKQFYWDGTKEVDICGCSSDNSVDIANAVWESQQRTLTNSDEIASNVWQNEDRTLTQELSCPNNDEQLDEIQQLLETLLARVNAVRQLPTTQTPRIGNTGTSATNTGGINIS